MFEYGLAELLLVQPGAAFYRAAPPADAPGVAAALVLAESDRAAGRGPRFDAAEIDQLRLTHGAAQTYAAAQHPERLLAPPPWPQELALLCATALLAALGGRMRSWRTALLWGPVYIAAAGGIGWARVRAERRAARELGLTALTAPQRSVSPHLAVLFVVAAVHGLLRLTGHVQRRRQPPWPTLAAQDVIRRLDERRSWRRAYAAAVARSDQARSSAASSTSGGCAPETP